MCHNYNLTIVLRGPNTTILKEIIIMPILSCNNMLKICNACNSRRQTRAVIHKRLPRNHQRPIHFRRKAVPLRRKRHKAGTNSLRVVYLPLLKAGAKQPRSCGPSGLAILGPVA